MAASSRRSRAARVAALTRWAHEDPKPTALRGQQGLRARFEREVDPDATLPVAERAERADRLMRAHMTRLAGRSADARRGRGR